MKMKSEQCRNLLQSLETCLPGTKISIEIERWPDKNMQDTFLTCGGIKTIAV